MNHSATLRQLQYFIAVAEAGNFRRAAARLRVSQPTLSNQVAALEKSLSIQVLERSHAGSVLTPAGRDLLPSARRVVEEFQGFLDRAKSMSRGPVGTFRLGVTPTLGPYLLPYVLPEIHRKYEALQFYVREDAPRFLEDDLVAGEHDLILVPLPVRAGDLRIAPLMREPVQLVLPADHRLAPTDSVDPEDLRDEAVLTLQEHHHFHHQIDQLCKRLGAHVLRDYEGTSLDTLRQMVVMGMGIAFLPALYVRSEIHQSQELCVTEIRGERLERTHALVWRPSSPGDALFRRIANDIRGLVADLLPGEVSVLQDS
tara:strand:+ start:3500 stop:4438 length:939 start_codon:yes stop_codon:yes gene_type:complete